MVATFVLFLREGLEASLIISILLAALRQLGQTEKMRAVWVGIAVAVVGSLAGSAVIYATLRDYKGTTFEKVFETVAFLLAVVMLTGVTFWMQRHSRTLKREIVVRASLAASAFTFALLGFTTVGREALETAVFSLALALQGSGAGAVLGAVLGLGVSIGVSVLIYRFGYRLDYGLFFRVMGLLLIVFAAGLLGNAVHEMQELGWLPFLTAQIYNIGQYLPTSGGIGSFLKAFLGYSDSPSLLQGLAYLAYLATAVAIFLRLSRRPAAPAVASTSLPTARA